MFGKRYHLGTLFGFPIRLDPSWFIILFLLTWTLSMGYFPNSIAGLSALTYWSMGILAALGLFGSVIVHELSHSLVARRYGQPPQGITLFVFGGVSELSEEPKNPKSEFLIAIVGPATSVVLAVLFFILEVAGVLGNWPRPVTGIVGYLGFINLLLAIFNILPAFPLDGGRVLRSALWKFKNDLRWATKIASRIGSGFGIALIILGIFSAFTGAIIAGLWWFFIGMFLRSSANAAYQQLLIQENLKGKPVSRFMQTTPLTVSRQITLEDLVSNYAYRSGHRFFPVVDNGELEGCIDLDRIKELPREEWPQHQVSEITASCPVAKTVAPETDASEAFALMNRTGQTHLIVTVDNRLVGMLNIKDLLRYLSMKKEFESGNQQG